MPTDGKRVAKARIDALLRELRSWEPGFPQRTVEELSRLFKLETWVVQQIARSEDIELGSDGSDEHVDPSASTLDLDPDEVEEALNKPDPNPDWEDKDADTAVYRRNPSTGEFERLDAEDSGDSWTDDDPDPQR